MTSIDPWPGFQGSLSNGDILSDLHRPLTRFSRSRLILLSSNTQHNGSKLFWTLWHCDWCDSDAVMWYVVELNIHPMLQFLQVWILNGRTTQSSRYVCWRPAKKRRFTCSGREVQRAVRCRTFAFSIAGNAQCDLELDEEDSYIVCHALFQQVFQAASATALAVGWKRKSADAFANKHIGMQPTAVARRSVKCFARQACGRTWSAVKADKVIWAWLWQSGSSPCETILWITYLKIASSVLSPVSAGLHHAAKPLRHTNNLQNAFVGGSHWESDICR